MNVILAIVIPAFRIKHLAETLESLARQTDQRFRLYIGDDASPDPIASCVSRFGERLNLDYHRFESNAGAHDLVAHWHRCIDRTNGEPWIWLFSDDDLAEPECVARFHQTVAESPTVDLYRFQMDFIDDRSRRFFRPVDHPDYEDALDLFEALLTDRYRAWRAQDHIFSRSVYETCGGFVGFPKGIYSDHATWLFFTTRSGVRTIRGPRVLWRSHPLGTSSGMREANRRQWQNAAHRYLEWLQLFAQKQGVRSVRVFRAKGLKFYFRELTYFRPVLTVAERLTATKFAQRHFGATRIGAYLYLHYVLVRYKFLYWRIAKPLLAWLKRRREKLERHVNSKVLSA